MSRETARPDGSSKPRRFTVPPVTRLGRLAVGLTVVHVALMLAWRVVPGGGGLGLGSGLVAGVVALVAIVRDRERALSVFIAILPLIAVVVFVLAELPVGHD